MTICLFVQFWLLEFDFWKGDGSAGSRRVACSAQGIDVDKAMKILET